MTREPADASAAFERPVGRAPVRFSLQVLERDGAVTTVVQIGKAVAVISFGVVSAILAIRFLPALVGPFVLASTGYLVVLWWRGTRFRRKEG
jgi:urea transporter